MLLPRLKVMTFSVELDDEPRRVADEISDVDVHRYLPTKTKTIDVMRLEVAPQQSLGARHDPPKLFRAPALSRADDDVRHPRLPPSLTLPHKGGGNRLRQAAKPRSQCCARHSRSLLLHHQAVDLDRRARIVRQAAASGALQLVAFLAAGDLDGAGIDVLAESRDAEMALRVGARHQARVAALDLGHHLGVGDALAAQAEILGEAEERRARLVLVALVEPGAARPGAARHRERDARRETHGHQDTGGK